MIHLWLFSAWFAMNAGSSAPAQPVPQVRDASQMRSTIDSILESGRCVQAGESPSDRVAKRLLIAPGLPPLLSFRYYEGKQHHGFGNSDLVLDDAGH
jgi:hypothetical protein